MATTDQNEPASSERLRPVSWGIWLAWVLVPALAPVLSTVSSTAFNKQFPQMETYPGLILAGLLALALVAAVAPPLLQGIVLKRVLPRVSLAIWAGCVLASCILWLGLTLSWHDLGVTAAGKHAESAIQSAASAHRWAGTLTAAQLLALPWGPFLLWAAATGALTALIPAWALGRASGLRRGPLLFFAAAIAGALAAGIVEQLYLLLLAEQPFGWALNGLSWTERFRVLANRAGVGAVWGATTAAFVVAATRGLQHGTASRTPVRNIGCAAGLAGVLAAPLAIAVLAPLAGYLAGPRGIVVGAPELRKVLSAEPARDRSEGEPVLTYSHDVAMPVARMFAVSITPDGQSAILRGTDHRLMLVDLASGRPMRQLAGALAPMERYDIAWSPDGRLLALRSNGAEVPSTRGGPSHQSRVRLYTMPDLVLTGEYRHSQGPCFGTFARAPMLFSSDGKSLWLACSQETAPRPDDPMAVHLDLPAMRTFDIVPYGAHAESGPIGGLLRIGGSLWAWQFSGRGAPLRVHDLTHRREVATIAMPTELTGDLTAQTGRLRIDEEEIRLDFCGAPPGSPRGTGPASWICRTLTFDTRRGALIGHADQADFRVGDPQAAVPNSVVRGRGLRIDAFWGDDSKAGELVVRDEVSGRERQRIVSMAQRVVQISPDGAWLITSPRDRAGLRLYRIRP